MATLTAINSEQIRQLSDEIIQIRALRLDARMTSIEDAIKASAEQSDRNSKLQYTSLAGIAVSLLTQAGAFLHRKLIGEGQPPDNIT